jgi:hypothetical protein
MSNPPNPSKIPDVQGGAISPLDRFWLDTARNAAKESVSSLEEAAKQLIAIATLTQTIYFAAISFSDLKKALSQLVLAQQWEFVILLAIPIALWLISLWFAIRVFKPETYRTNLNSPDLAREMYFQVVAYKHKQLQRAYLALAVGFIPLLLNVVLYLIYAPAPPKG